MMTRFLPDSMAKDPWLPLLLGSKQLVSTLSVYLSLSLSLSVCLCFSLAEA